MTTATLNRKPVFDAFRDILGRGLTQSEVDMLDAAFERGAGVPTPTASSHVLGELSEEFESGGRGPGTVSGGQGDPGGVSYGLWQIASKTGTMAAFVATEGAPWRAEFGGAVPGSPRFSEVWRTIAAREPEGFTQAQRAFIERSHYRPAVKTVKASTSLDLDSRHDAVRDATWSVAVQHGGAAKILIAAVNRADRLLARDNPLYDRALVEATYAERSAYVLGVAARASSGERKTLESVVRNRYPAELAKALAMLGVRA